MKLTDYLKKYGFSVNKFAKLHGFSQSTIWRVTKGHRPRPDIAIQIERATKGKVKRLEVLYP